jgi:hypothetical protein
MLSKKYLLWISCGSHPWRTVVASEKVPEQNFEDEVGGFRTRKPQVLAPGTKGSSSSLSYVSDRTLVALIRLILSN